MRSPRVLFVIHANPAAYPPIERAAHALRDRGAGVRLLGVSGGVTDAFEATRHNSLDVRLHRRGDRGPRAKFQYALFLVAALVHCARWRPTWVYLSDTLTTPLAALVRLLGARVLYHEHDAPDVGHSTAFTRLLARTREWAIRHTDVVVTPNADRSRALEQMRGGPVFTVWNCPGLDEVRSRPHRRRNDDFRILYQGSLSAARLPLTLVDAIARVPPSVRLFIRAYETEGSRGYLERFVEHARGLGVADRIERLPAVPREEMQDFTASCDLGLALMPTASGEPNERAMAGASNKAFEYLACGVPVLVTDLPDWRRIFVDAGVALSCDPDDPSSIAAAISLAVSDRKKTAAMGEHGRELVVSEWNYPRQFARVAAVLMGAGAGASDTVADDTPTQARYVRS